MEYLTLGMETIRVIQSYNANTSHRRHWENSKDYADYPIDLAGAGGNRSAYFATVDMEVVAIKGQASQMTNTIWLKTVDMVETPSGVFRAFIALTHWNDNDSAIRKLKVGTIVRKGTIICYEGTDGATANHLHLVCGNADKSLGDSLIKNSNGSWVSSGYCLKPEEVFYIDRDFSVVVDTKDITFIDKPEVEYYTRVPTSYVSIVDALKSIGVDSSFANRRRIALANDIKNYLGIPSQNREMLNLLKIGSLIKY